MKTMKSKIFEADKPNLKGYVFPKEELEKAIGSWNSIYPKPPLVFEDYSDNSSLLEHKNLAGSCSLEMVGDSVIATVKIDTQTPKGGQLSDLIQAGGRVNCLSKGMGRLSFSDSTPDSATVSDYSISKIVCAVDVACKNDRGLFELVEVDEKDSE